MKLLFVICVLAAVLAVPAQASAPTNAKLQREIAALAKQNQVLRSQVSALTQRVQRDEDMTTCNYAVGSDNLNLVWHTLNLMAQYMGFPPQPDFPKYDDSGACSRLGVTRTR